jgi:hypothetical protein
MSKLYTEEQVRFMISQARFQDYNDWHLYSDDAIIEEQTPIELPTDEEIDTYIKSFPFTKHLDDGQYNDGVIVGVELGIEWVINKIKGGEE